MPKMQYEDFEIFYSEQSSSIQKLTDDIVGDLSILPHSPHCWRMRSPLSGNDQDRERVYLKLVLSRMSNVVGLTLQGPGSNQTNTSTPSIVSSSWPLRVRITLYSKSGEKLDDIYETGLRNAYDESFVKMSLGMRNLFASVVEVRVLDWGVASDAEKSDIVCGLRIGVLVLANEESKYGVVEAVQSGEADYATHIEKLSVAVEMDATTESKHGTVKVVQSGEADDDASVAECAEKEPKLQLQPHLDTLRDVEERVRSLLSTHQFAQFSEYQCNNVYAQPRSDWRTIRLYVASPHMDMKEERRILHTEIAPALRNFCMGFNLNLVVVDLQLWRGREASLFEDFHGAMDELSRCRENEVDSTMPSLFLAFITSDYGVVPRLGFGDEGLSELSELHGFVQGVSLLAMEIVHGLSVSSAMGKINTDALVAVKTPLHRHEGSSRRRSSVYDREMRYAVPNASLPCIIEVETEGPVSIRARDAELASLKQFVRDKLETDQLLEYKDPTELVYSLESSSDADASAQMSFGDSIVSFFKKAIRRRLQRVRKPMSSLIRPQYFHREDELSNLLSFARNDVPSPPLVIRGAEGVGKTSLLEHFLKTIQISSDPTFSSGHVSQHWQIVRLLGHDTSLQGVLSALARAGLLMGCADHLFLPYAADILVSRMRYAIDKAAASAADTYAASKGNITRRTIIVIDIPPNISERAAGILTSCIPEILPVFVKCIIAASVGCPVYEKLTRRRLSSIVLLPLSELRSQVKAGMVSSALELFSCVFADDKRSLNLFISQLVFRDTAYLVTALQWIRCTLLRASHRGSTTTATVAVRVNSALRELESALSGNHTIDNLYKLIIDKAVAECGAPVIQLLCLIRCSRFGLHEADLMNILGGLFLHEEQEKPPSLAASTSCHSSLFPSGRKVPLSFERLRDIVDLVAPLLVLIDAPVGSGGFSDFIDSEGTCDYDKVRRFKISNSSVCHVIDSKYLDSPHDSSLYRYILVDYFRSDAVTLSARAEEVAYQLISLHDFEEAKVELMRWDRFQLIASNSSHGISTTANTPYHLCKYYIYADLLAFAQAARGDHPRRPPSDNALEPLGEYSTHLASAISKVLTNCDDPKIFLAKLNIYAKFLFDVGDYKAVINLLKSTVENVCEGSLAYETTDATLFISFADALSALALTTSETTISGVEQSSAATALAESTEYYERALAALTKLKAHACDADTRTQKLVYLAVAKMAYATITLQYVNKMLTPAEISLRDKQKMHPRFEMSFAAIFRDIVAIFEKHREQLLPVAFLQKGIYHFDCYREARMSMAISSHSEAQAALTCLQRSLLEFERLNLCLCDVRYGDCLHVISTLNFELNRKRRATLYAMLAVSFKSRVVGYMHPSTMKTKELLVTLMRLEQISNLLHREENDESDKLLLEIKAMDFTHHHAASGKRGTGVVGGTGEGKRPSSTPLKKTRNPVKKEADPHSLTKNIITIAHPSDLLVRIQALNSAESTKESLFSGILALRKYINTQIEENGGSDCVASLISTGAVRCICKVLIAHFDDPKLTIEALHFIRLLSEVPTYASLILDSLKRSACYCVLWRVISQHPLSSDVFFWGFTIVLNMLRHSSSANSKESSSNAMSPTPMEVASVEGAVHDNWLLDTLRFRELAVFCMDAHVSKFIEHERESYQSNENMQSSALDVLLALCNALSAIMASKIDDETKSQENTPRELISPLLRCRREFPKLKDKITNLFSALKLGTPEDCPSDYQLSGGSSVLSMMNKQKNKAIVQLELPRINERMYPSLETSVVSSGLPLIRLSQAQYHVPSLLDVRRVPHAGGAAGVGASGVSMSLSALWDSPTVPNVLTATREMGGGEGSTAVGREPLELSLEDVREEEKKLVVLETENEVVSLRLRLARQAAVDLIRRRHQRYQRQQSSGKKKAAARVFPASSSFDDGGSDRYLSALLRIDQHPQPRHADLMLASSVATPTSATTYLFNMSARQEEDNAVVGEASIAKRAASSCVLVTAEEERNNKEARLDEISRCEEWFVKPLKKKPVTAAILAPDKYKRKSKASNLRLLSSRVNTPVTRAIATTSVLSLFE